MQRAKRPNARREPGRYQANRPEHSYEKCKIFSENVNSKCEKNIKKYNQASRANSSRHSANTISAVFQPNISRG